MCSRVLVNPVLLDSPTYLDTVSTHLRHSPSYPMFDLSHSVPLLLLSWTHMWQSCLWHWTLGNWLLPTSPGLEFRQFPFQIFVFVPTGCLSLFRFSSTMLASFPPGLGGTVSVLVYPPLLNHVSFLFRAFLFVCFSLSLEFLCRTYIFVGLFYDLIYTEFFCFVITATIRVGLWSRLSLYSSWVWAWAEVGNILRCDV